PGSLEAQIRLGRRPRSRARPGPAPSSPGSAWRHLGLIRPISIQLRLGTDTNASLAKTPIPPADRRPGAKENMQLIADEAGMLRAILGLRPQWALAFSLPTTTKFSG